MTEVSEKEITININTANTDARSLRNVELENDLITTFRLTTGRDGAQVDVVGCMELLVASDPDKGIVGVLLLPNESVSVIDLRKKPTAIGGCVEDSACIVLVDDEQDDGPVRTGLLVDGISDVLAIASPASGVTAGVKGATDIIAFRV